LAPITLVEGQNALVAVYVCAYNLLQKRYGSVEMQK